MDLYMVIETSITIGMATPTGQAKGFFNRDFDDADGDYADCPIPRQSSSGTELIDNSPDEDQEEVEETPPRQSESGTHLIDNMVGRGQDEGPPRQSESGTHLIDNMVGRGQDEGPPRQSASGTHLIDNMVGRGQDEPTEVEPTPTPRPSTPTTTETLDEVKEQDPTIPDEIKAEVLDVEPIKVTDEREWHDYIFHSGYNFVTFPILPNGVETLEGLYPHLYPETYGTVLLVYISGCWLIYGGEGETGMIPLTSNMGVVVYAEQPFSVTMFGSRVKDSELALVPGGNFVGVPSGVKRPSDLLDREDTVLYEIAVLREIEGKLYLIGRLGDSGDEEPFEDGEAVFLIVSGTAQAPKAYRASTLAASWGTMKRKDIFGNARR